ncbi:MAG: sigma-70 family RNA polymerase sigma factor [Acidobacteria bacterium]|nr:sigma-70 family RNA polymerase sigma factor [Acidobacteriota bacterium]
MDISPEELTLLLQSWEKGSDEALDRLIPLVYRELHQLASRCMSREEPGHTLQTSALINEAYLKLVNQRKVHWENRAHFLAIAARLMRRILVDHARQKHRKKRGGQAYPLSLEDCELPAETASSELVALNEALTSLEKIDPRKCRVVELRFFAGLTVEETAEVLKVSANTILRDWNMAKAWLYREISMSKTTRVDFITEAPQG